VGSLVLPSSNWEGTHDVGHIITVDSVEEEARGIQFGAELSASLGVPPKRRALVTEVAGKVSDVDRGVGELKDAGCHPLGDGLIG
jgi:hypothetical protein